MRKCIAHAAKYYSHTEHSNFTDILQRRFGPGCTTEVGMDFANLRSKKVMIVTDSTVEKLDAMKQCLQGLDQEGIQYVVYSKARVEPKDTS